MDPLQQQPTQAGQQPSASVVSPVQAGSRHSMGKLVLWLVILVALIGIGYVLYTNVLQSTNAGDKISDAVSLLNAGDDEAAILAARDLLQNTTSAKEQALATRVLSYAYFYSGTTTQQLQAVQLMKDQYRRDQGNQKEQAIDISILLEFITQSRDANIFTAVFSEEFLPYKKGSDVTGSIQQLAEYANSLYPTTTSLFQLALRHAAPLPSTRSGLTEEQRKESADKAIEYLQRADTAYAEETQSDFYKGNLMAPLKYQYWRAFLWGDVARVYPEHLKESEEAFKAGIAYFDATRDAEGNTYAYLEARMPIHYVSYAGMLIAVDGANRAADIRVLLDTVVAMVNAHPERHAQFIAQIRRAADRTNANVSFGSFRRLANFHKPFADFLAEYGYAI